MSRSPTTRIARVGSFALLLGAAVLAARALAGPDAEHPLRAQGQDARLFLPLALQRATPIRPTPFLTPALPSVTPTSTRAPTVAAASATPTPTRIPPGPGIPDCDRSRGDAGGFRFSLDGGRSLAPNASPLASLAYTWDLDIDPRDPDRILQLHQGILFASEDAGCTFELLARPGDWDRLWRAPSDPDLLVASSVFRSALRHSEDGGATWQAEEPLPADVFGLAIAPDDPWHWQLVGRDGVLYERLARDRRWEGYPMPTAAAGSVTAAEPGGPFGRWWVGTGGAGLFVTEDGGRSWREANAGLGGTVGEPPEPVTALVVSWVTAAPSDPDLAYLVVNRVGRGRSERGIWRTADGGAGWERRVVDGQAVGERVAEITGGTRVFVDPRDPERAFFPYGLAYEAYGTDLFRSDDGLRSLAVTHFDGFYEVFALAFGPPGTPLLYLGTSSDIPQ